MEKEVVRIKIKDEFNGQVVTVAITLDTWDKLVMQVESARAQQRKANNKRLDA